MSFLNELDPILLRWLQALLVFLLFFPVGCLLRKVIFFYFEKWAEKSGNKHNEIIIARSRAHALFWAFLIGVHVSATIAPLGEKTFIFFNKAIFSLFIISLTLIIANVISDIAKTYSRKASLSLPLTSLTDNLIKLTVVSLGGLIALAHLGISIAPLLTALGVGSLAVALALQDTLTNLFSGFYIIANKQTRPGDYIRLDSGQEGCVVDIGWRTTRIKPLSDNIILIPNAKLGAAIVTNFHIPENEMSMSVPVSVSYSSDLDKVESVTIEVAKETLKEVRGGAPDFAPSVRFNCFGDSAVKLDVNLRVKDFSDQALVTHEFIKRLHKRYMKEGIDIPFPQRAVHVINPENK